LFTWLHLARRADVVGAVVVEEVSISPVKLPICQLREESFPEGAFSDPVTLEDLTGGGAERERLPLEGSVQGPVGLSPGVVRRQ